MHSLPNNSPSPTHSLPLRRLYRDVSHCDVCHLRTQKAPGVGNEHARVLLLAQNPGKPHPGAGFVPFDFLVWGTGLDRQSSGYLLQKMLALARIPSTDIYITNAQKCGGAAAQKYVTNCSDWLEEELLLLKNIKLIVSLGTMAATRIGARQSRLDQYESRFSSIKTYIMTAVTHPAALYRPNSIGLVAYARQWRFVGAAYRQV